MNGDVPDKLVPMCRLERLERRELMEAQPFHDVRVPGAETQMALSRSPCGATAIHEGMLSERKPLVSSNYDLI
jgi:hypothetical protein